MPPELFTAGGPPARRVRAFIAVLAVVALGLLAVSAWIAFDLQRFQDRYAGRLLPGITIAGIELDGATRAEALALVDGAFAEERDRQLTLRLADVHWTATLGELGFETDAAERIDEAMALTSEQSLWDLLQLRWERDRLDVDLPVTSRVPEETRRELVRRIADEAWREAVDAEISWDRTRPQVTPESIGRRVDVSATLAGLAAAIEEPSARLVDVIAEEVVPVVTQEAFRQILFLRQHDHELDLYHEGRLVRTYTVAVGTGSYPTPTGRYEVTLKRHRPTWVNPSPSGWGRNMPARIGPGPNNPLGLRALNWSAPGAIRFHGTADVDSLGRDASHGCVRLSNADIVELYDLVDEGAVIISTS